MSVEDSDLTTCLSFDFCAPSPLGGESHKRVTIQASVIVSYEVDRDSGSANQDELEAFGRVNGVYNAWPYLREYVQSSLVRLGLPPFDLPLLRVAEAVQLAGMVEQLDHSEEEG